MCRFSTQRTASSRRMQATAPCDNIQVRVGVAVGATIVVDSARRAIDRLLWILSGAMWQLSISLIVRGERRDRSRSRAYPTRVALCVGVGVVVPPYLTVAISQRTACKAALVAASDTRAQPC